MFRSADGGREFDPAAVARALGWPFERVEWLVTRSWGEQKVDLWDGPIARCLLNLENGALPAALNGSPLSRLG
jgi:hypothetical protein